MLWYVLKICSFAHSHCIYGKVLIFDKTVKNLNLVLFTYCGMATIFYAYHIIVYFTSMRYT